MVRREAYAKINLALDITGKREDGYHLVRMVMQTIDLHDTITLDTAEGKSGEISLTMEFADKSKGIWEIPDDDNNLCIKAARALMDRADVKQNVTIHLVKRIPAEAGLAGGSTDAAAVLSGFNELLNIKYTIEELSEIALEIGADVPYCLRGGTMLAEGVGELLSPIEPQIDGVPAVLLKPDFGMSTAEVYKLYDAITECGHPDIEGLVDVIKKGFIERSGDFAGNVLEEVAVREQPVIRDIKTCLEKNGAYYASVTGSGPTVYGLFSDMEKAKAAVCEAGERYPGYFVCCTRLCSRS